MPHHITRPVPRPERQQSTDSPYAPQESLRPQARPDGLGQSNTPGIFPELGVQDETARFGSLGRRQRRGDPSEVVLHQTDTDTAEQVRTAYDERVEAGGSVGAHYLIDTDGSTSLTVPTDRVSSHVRGHNSASVGIENVGRAERLNRRGDLRAQVEEMELAAPLRAELLAMDDRQLRRTLADSGYNIYGDITGPQKRANWNLVNALSDAHGLDPGTDVNAHEHLQAKTIGEGENIELMIDAMIAWPDKIEQLRQRITAMIDAGEDDATVSALQAVLLEQETAQAAAEADGTMAERNMLDGEEMMGGGGPASEREQTRTAFWDDFWGHMQRLDEALAEQPSG